MDSSISKELSRLALATWAPDFTVRGKNDFHDFATQTYHVAYPSRGRKTKQVPGIPNTKRAYYSGLEAYYAANLPFLLDQVPYVYNAPPSVFETNLRITSEAKGWDCSYPHSQRKRTNGTPKERNQSSTQWFDYFFR